jgi:hypothetical protein
MDQRWVMPQQVKREEEIIKKFVKKEVAAPQFMFGLVDKLADIVTITPDGNVSVIRKCPTKDRVAAVAIARFLGHALEEKLKIDIKAEISREEVTRYAGIDKLAASARLKDLTDEGLLERITPGIFRVRSLSQAERWIDLLCEKYVKKKATTHERE